MKMIYYIIIESQINTKENKNSIGFHGNLCVLKAKLGKIFNLYNYDYIFVSCSE